MLLSEGTVADYVAARLRGSADPPLALDSVLLGQEIRGGNLNFAFVVVDAGGRAVFVKQAPDFIKVFGPEAKLSRQRMRLEHAAYQEWAQVLGPAEASRYLPKVYTFDEDNMVLIMEFLGTHQVLEHSLFAGAVDARIAGALGEAMGLIHAKTHCSMVPPCEAARLAAAFENTALRELQLEYVFSKCYREDPRAEYLRLDAAFMAEVDALKAAYRGDGAEDLALVHGDLHAGSVMADPCSADVRLIDPEFAIYGPPGLDVGSLMSTYALAFCSRAVSTGGRPGTALLEAVEGLWAAYAATMVGCGISSGVVARAAELALGFAGCEIARTALGMAGERTLRIPDAAQRDKAERGTLQVGARCIAGRHGNGPDFLIAELQRFARSNSCKP